MRRLPSCLLWPPPDRVDAAEARMAKRVTASGGNSASLTSTVTLLSRITVQGWKIVLSTIFLGENASKRTEIREVQGVPEWIVHSVSSENGVKVRTHRQLWLYLIFAIYRRTFFAFVNFRVREGISRDLEGLCDNLRLRWQHQNEALKVLND